MKARVISLRTPAAGRQLKIAVYDGGEAISNFLRLYGVWQRPLTMFLRAYLKPGDVFVDIGANIGYFSLYAAAAVGAGGRVHAFEPDPENAKMLATNLKLNEFDNTAIHEVALSGEPGEAHLYTSSDNRGLQSLLAKEGLSDKYSVRVLTLDEALKDESRSIKLIKIDVQGLELSVLRGMSGRLEESEIKPSIIMEFTAADFHKQDPDLAAFSAFMTRNNYDLRAFIANERLSVAPPRITFDTLRRIYNDFVRYGEDAEFDILLTPAR